MKKVRVELFNTEVYLVENKKDIKVAKKYFNDSRTSEWIDADDYLGLCLYSTKKTFLFVKNNQISILAHEVLHAVVGICKDRGINDEETECYLMDYILKGLLDKNKNKIK